MCAVAALIPGGVLGVEQRPPAANLQAMSNMAVLQGLRAEALVTSGESPTHRQQVGEVLRPAPWDGIAGAFLTRVWAESRHAVPRDGLTAPLRGNASKEDAAAVAAVLREWHGSTRVVWLQPLGSA